MIVNKLLITFLSVVFCSFKLLVFSQIINGYAQGLAISGAVVNLTEVDELYDTFEDGEYIFVIQMQDDVIGETGNVSTFGDVGSINTAGRFEIRQIVSHSETAGVPTQITLDAAPTYSYNYGDNHRYQLITFPTLGSPNYTTTGNLEAKVWDGNTGGVLAFSCPGTLTLNHHIDANQKGYRGGTANGGSALGCTPGVYRTASSDDHANKGEGIYRINTSANPEYVAARGRILNGAGGGNSHNAGGGGGGNYTNGGDGGPGWQSGGAGYCSPSAGGIGGYGLGPSDQNVISTTRLFMGGGGGAGEGNNSLATDGGDGGGIVFIKAEEIRTLSGCTPGTINISSNGQASVLAAGNDGGGGGGAGGSIILQVNTFDIDCGCPLNFEANGGPGGSISAPTHHGGGGGGGQGAIAFSTPTVPAGCVTISTNNGEGGCNNNSNPCNFQAANGGGTDDDGILTGFVTNLPIEIGQYSAVCLGNYRSVSWETLSENNTALFVIERSYDNVEWEVFETVDATGWSQSSIYYTVNDYDSPRSSQTYYKLKSVDFDGTIESKFVVSVDNCAKKLFLYPNPSKSIVTANFDGKQPDDYQIYNVLGQAVSPKVLLLDDRFVFDFSGFNDGVYHIKFFVDDRVEYHSIVILND